MILITKWNDNTLRINSPIMITINVIIPLLGNLIITLDPVFNGLALAIIFGIVASTLFTLLVVPLVYWLVFKDDEDPGPGEGVTA